VPSEQAGFSDRKHILSRGFLSCVVFSDTWVSVNIGNPHWITAVEKWHSCCCYSDKIRYRQASEAGKKETPMSDYGIIYLIDTSYNADRDAREVTFGYIEKEDEVKGRIMSLRVIVNVPGHRDDVKGAVEAGLAKARALALRAAGAPYEPD
jgi:hypothetical protein